jgi:hypothetical protein
MWETISLEFSFGEVWVDAKAFLVRYLIVGGKSLIIIWFSLSIDPLSINGSIL